MYYGLQMPQFAQKLWQLGRLGWPRCFHTSDRNLLFNITQQDALLVCFFSPDRLFGLQHRLHLVWRRIPTKQQSVFVTVYSKTCWCQQQSIYKCCLQAVQSANQLQPNRRLAHIHRQVGAEYLTLCLSDVSALCCSLYSIWPHQCHYLHFVETNFCFVPSISVLKVFGSPKLRNLGLFLDCKNVNILWPLLVKSEQLGCFYS